LGVQAHRKVQKSNDLREISISFSSTNISGSFVNHGGSLSNKPGRVSG
jgi:hypothetical protein